jgi:hypothetical protein
VQQLLCITYTVPAEKARGNRKKHGGLYPSITLPDPRGGNEAVLFHYRIENNLCIYFQKKGFAKEKNGAILLKKCTRS